MRPTLLTLLLLAPLLAQAQTPPPNPLERRVELRLRATPIQLALRVIAERCKLRLSVDPDARRALGRQRVSLTANSLTARQALALMLEVHGLVAQRQRDTLRVIDPDGKLATLHAVRRLYDLSGSELGAYRPGSFVDLAGTLGRQNEEDEEIGTEVISSETLIDTVQAFVYPDIWERDNLAISSISNRMLVVAPHFAQARVAALLKQIRTAQPSAPVRVHAWRVPRALPADLDQPLARWLASEAKQPADKRARYLALTVSDNQRTHTSWERAAPEGSSLGEQVLLDAEPMLVSASQAHLTLRWQHRTPAERQLDVRRLRSCFSLGVGRAVLAGARGGSKPWSLVVAVTANPSPRSARDQVLERPMPARAQLRLTRALEALSETLEVECLRHPALIARAGLEVDPLVGPLPAGQARDWLETLAEQGKLDWRWHGPAIVIEGLDCVSSRLYPVRIPYVTHFNEPPLRPLPSDLFEEYEPMTSDGLVTTITESIGPDSWDDEYSIRMRGGFLIARNRAIWQRAVRRLLSRLHRPDRQRSLELRWLQGLPMTLATQPTIDDERLRASGARLNDRVVLRLGKGWVGLLDGRQRLIEDEEVQVSGTELTARVAGVKGGRLLLHVEGSSLGAGGAREAFSVSSHVREGRWLVIAHKGGRTLIVRVTDR